MATNRPQQYDVLNGINYPDGKGGEKRADPGDVVSDLPEKAVRWLSDQGHIRAAEDRPEPLEEDAL